METKKQWIAPEVSVIEVNGATGSKSDNLNGSS